MLSRGSEENVACFIRKREYRQSYKEKSSNFEEKWYRSKRSVNTLGYWKDLEGHKGCVNTINFNMSGDLLVSGSDDKEIKIWNVETQKCLETLRGHVSNVFAADFLPYRSNKEIISGGNDSDMRHYDLEKKTCTVYSHHMKKVLRLSINPQNPDSFLSCSADGTIRMIDIRQKYDSSYTHKFDEYENDEDVNDIMPQACGGGRVSKLKNWSDGCKSSLVLDYKLDSLVASRQCIASATLFSVDFHPDGNRFIVGSAYGNVRLFDLRKIVNHNPGKSHINVYRNSEWQFERSYEITGCVFSKDGSEIVATALHNFIYVFDVNTNYMQLYGLDYFSPHKIKRETREEPEKSEKKSSKSEKEKEVEEEEEGSSDEWDYDQEEEVPPSQKTYKEVYKGHYSASTIKGVNFYGPNSEFVISGSDDHNIYIWDKKTGELLTILEGHDSIVNCIVGHPSQPMIASSGIDNVVKLWQNVDNYPTESQLKKRKTFMEKTANENSHRYSHYPTRNIDPIVLLISSVSQRIGEGFFGW